MSYMDVMGGFGSQWTNAPAPPTYTPAWSPMQLAAQNQGVVNGITNAFQTQGPASGYGTVGGYPSFGGAAAPGTYSPGNAGGLSSFSGTSLGGGVGGSVWNTGAAPYQDYGQPQPGSFEDRWWGGTPDYGTTFDDRFNATPNTNTDPYAPTGGLPDIIRHGGYPGFDERWSPTSYMPPMIDAGGSRSGNVNIPGQQLNPMADPFASAFDTGADPFNAFGQPGISANRSPLDIFGGSAWNYLQANPDVRAAAGGNDPLAFAMQHYMNHGQNEGRGGFGLLGGSDAARQSYLDQNKDVFAAGADPLKHFREFGFGEGRSGAGLITPEAQAYYDANPDVKAAAIAQRADPSLFAAEHYQNWGAKEGRDSYGLARSAAQQYLDANSDLSAAFGSDRSKAEQHYRDFGAKEGREGYGLSALPEYDWAVMAKGGGGNAARRYGLQPYPGAGDGSAQDITPKLPGSPYGWGYQDRTFGEANDMNASRNGIADAWLQQQGANPALGHPGGSGNVGGPMDPFSSYPYSHIGNNPSAVVDYRFPAAGTWPQVDNSQRGVAGAAGGLEGLLRQIDQTAPYQSYPYQNQPQNTLTPGDMGGAYYNPYQPGG